MSMSDIFLPEKLERELQNNGLDVENFYARVLMYRAGQYPTNNLVSASPMEGIPNFGDIKPAAETLGIETIKGAKVALAIINGGMATRFGGEVKGIVEVLPDYSFIRVMVEKVKLLSRKYKAPVPIIFMNSVQTDQATKQHLEQNDYFGYGQEQFRFFSQSNAPRLSRSGSYYHGADGYFAQASSGHGDFFTAIRTSGTLDWLKSQGIENILISNVDNLGAEIHPKSLGYFKSLKSDMLCEVVEKQPEEIGGVPVLVEGRPRIAEWFTLPYNMQFENLKHINTNNIWVDLRRLHRPLPLHWYAVEKTVTGDLIIQFERLIAQYSWYCDCTILQVPQSHFIPAKTKQQIVENSGSYKNIIAELESL
ncbi:MAG: UTP--glucose-1-phosphate uridylyltransferase [Alphaproteobacteria bacterium]|nr:UTP--glucose-1-phosphate uridylyltransferase [Alphaproteobacteria bacterium]